MLGLRQLLLQPQLGWVLAGRRLDRKHELHAGNVPADDNCCCCSVAAGAASAAAAGNPLLLLPLLLLAALAPYAAMQATDP